MRRDTEQRNSTDVRRACAQAVRSLASGDLDVAERDVRRVLAQAPDCVEALFLLAQCVRRRPAQDGQYEALLRRILQIALHPQASLELAQLLLARGETDECEQHARSAVALAPRNPFAHRTMGIVFLKSGRPAAAEFHFRKIIELVGERPRVCALLADALKLQGKLDESGEWFERATAQDPDNSDLWSDWCRLAEARGRLPEAWETLKRASALAPRAPNVCLARAVLLAREGRRGDAEQTLSDALAGEPHHAGLYFERGRIRKELGRYDEAWADYVEANRLCRESEGLLYRKGHVDDLFGQLKQFFTRDRMMAVPRAAERADAPRPIFIVGFPRSGTTLVEQMLVQHALVRAGDELEFLAQVAAMAARWIGSRHNYPECLAELATGDNVHTVDHLRDAYLDRARQVGLLSGTHRFFTDKMPLNELHLGLIAILFPRAPIILMRRHPLDVVCSNFESHVRHGFNQSFDLLSIAHHIVAMDALVSHYRSEIDFNLLEVRYEDVVADPEREIRRMLDFVELEFDPRCLRFAESARVPRTISYVQVGQELHGRSVFRYRHFRQHLHAAAEVLAPIIARLGYGVA